MSAPMTYPLGTPAPWPLRLPDDHPPRSVDELRDQCEAIAARAQYGWGHTIEFGPFTMPGLLGAKYLRIAGVLDEWGWWPERLDGKHVADIGCFTGGLSVLMAARGAASVAAVDEVPEHLEQCDLVAGAFGMDAVTTHQASLFELAERMEPESLDVILFAGVLYHLSDMLVGMVALQRLLRPGGLLIVETNAVECFDHSYANFARYFGGGWWQPTARCVADLCEYSGLGDGAEVRFYQPGRALARVVKPEGATVPFKRGMNWSFEDLRDERERSLDPGIMAPAPCHHADAGMLGRAALRAGERALQAPMSLGYRWRRLTRRSRKARSAG
jgi:2-polyprenyl-3-methyl-5-hydroxy-6-metoxy-1,4-benzoquinol methylase